MADKKEQRKKYITPKGIAVYPWLNRPDVKHKPEGQYKVDLRLSEADAAPLIELLTPMHEEAVAAAKANPKNKNKNYPTWPICKPALDEEGNETGDVLFTFKRAASGISKKTQKPWAIKPDLFDAKGNPLPAEAQIWGGSIIKVSFSVNAYDKPVGNGISLALEAVQVLKLVEGSGRSASQYGFDNESDDDDSDTDGTEEGSDTPEGGDGTPATEF